MTETTTNQAEDTPRNRRRVIQGIVSSDAMDKSIGVRVERMFKHPKYKKYIRRHSKIQAHDETNEAHVGDRVEIMECRPLSKSKRWRLVRIVERPALAAGAADPTALQSDAVEQAMGEQQPGGEA